MSQKLFIVGGVLAAAVVISVAILPPLSDPESIKQHRTALGVPVYPKAGIQRGSMWKEMDKEIKDTSRDEKEKSL